jgi:transcriptional regulator with XRE-family HTH domain
VCLCGVDYGIQTNTCQRFFGFQMSTGDRLREERERTGLNQVAFAALGGVKKLAQINYEKGERSPDADYLAGLAAAGVDVLYVITGQRLTDVIRAAMPTGPKAELIALFDGAKLSVQAEVIRLLHGGGESPPGPSGMHMSGSGNQFNAGAGAVQIGSIGGGQRTPRKPTK